MKHISILGSTGTIGKNTLDIVERNRDKFSIAALAAQDNVELLADQAKKFSAKFAAIGNESHYKKLKEILSEKGVKNIEIATGSAAVKFAAEIDCDIVMSAIVGSAGLAPTIAAIRKGRRVALANKECLVSAGWLINSEVAKHNASIIPVDSEHSGLFQLLDNSNNNNPNKVTITASGGPFRKYSLAELSSVTPQQAIKHPNWKMGKKISVDSASLMNKGLELIEAHYLFSIPPENLAAIIHPQSIIHAMIEFADGSAIAQLSNPDMRAPISYALSYPERIKTPVAKLNLAALGKLEFEEADYTRFPCLRLAIQAMKAGGSATTILNAANEIAVARFLRNDISFMQIPIIVEKSLSAINKDMPDSLPESLEEIIEIDNNTRRLAEAA